MSKGDSRRGIQRERDMVNHLRSENWFAMRAPASLGVADVVALKLGETPMFLELKSTTAGPFTGFPPADRQALLDAAFKAGAVPWLVHWPKRSKPVWIPAEDWPG